MRSLKSILSIFSIACLVGCVSYTSEQVSNESKALEKTKENSTVAGEQAGNVEGKEVVLDDVIIREASIEGDVMTLHVDHTGCEPHKFQLSWNGITTRSYPAQANLNLAHAASTGGCTKTVDHVLHFDLKQLEPKLGKPTSLQIVGSENSASHAMYGEAKTGLPSKGKCRREGCSGQLCVSADRAPIYTTCEWKDEYACMNQKADDGSFRFPCERQSNGLCEFSDPTGELAQCTGDAKHPVQ